MNGIPALIFLVDNEKALDGVHRETLWKIIESYGIPPKLVRMVKRECTMVTNVQWQTASAGQTDHSDWFDVKSGVKQECNMSGYLFFLVKNSRKKNRRRRRRIAE